MFIVTEKITSGWKERFIFIVLTRKCDNYRCIAT